MIVRFALTIVTGSTEDSIELTCEVCGTSWPVDERQGYEISKIGHFALDHSYRCDGKKPPVISQTDLPKVPLGQNDAQVELDAEIRRLEARIASDEAWLDKNHWHIGKQGRRDAEEIIERCRRELTELRDERQDSGG